MKDKEFCATQLAELLASGGHETAVFANLQETVECLTADDFDMIVIELRLEDQDAVRLCADIRSVGALDPVAGGRNGCRSIGQVDGPRLQRLRSAPR